MSDMVSTYLTLFALQSFWINIVQTQNTSAECTVPEYTWAFNSKNETPCDVATELMKICYGTGVTTRPLTSPGDSYWGPWKGLDTPCDCTTVSWGLYAACAVCQNGVAISWSTWAYNCSNVTVESFPLSVPQQVVVPHWAYLKVGDDGYWNRTAARVDAENPPSSPHHSNAGAIVGGVVGGIAASGIGVVLFMLIRRRLRRKAARRPPSTLYGPEGTSPFKPGDTAAQPAATSGFTLDESTHQRLYDPSDPSTFPPPLDYDSKWSTANVGQPDHPESHPTIIY